MEKFVIITDSSSNLNKDLRDKYEIDYLPFIYNYEGKSYDSDLDWKTISAKEFYDMMRNGARITSSAVNVASYVETFEKYLSKGYDVLSISCTSALSTSVNSSFVARDQLKEKYPDRKIICIDSKICCGSLGLICVKAGQLRAQGKTIEEVASWVEENKLFFNQEGSVDKLIWLKQAGRVSASSAFFGGLLNIKPILVSDVHGYNVAVEKVKGRMTSITRVADRVAQSYDPKGAKEIFINHTDSLEDAIVMKDELKKRLNLNDEDFVFSYVTPSVGGAIGPGMFGVYFYGKKRTVDSKVN
ncbi:MAG: DegV family protein [Clostridia bacterium]|nr:DegV family protein [Clostridia bacterium]